VLPPSAIGDVAVYARRSGRDWYVGAVNGSGARRVTVTPSFLGRRRFTATIARDDLTDPAAITMDTATLSASTPITFELRDGGGFVVWLTPSGS